MDLKHAWDLGGCISKPHFGHCSPGSWPRHSSPGWKGLMDQLPLGLLCNTRQRISAWYSYHTECTNWWSVYALAPESGKLEVILSKPTFLRFGEQLHQTPVPLPGLIIGMVCSSHKKKTKSAAFGSVATTETQSWALRQPVAYCKTAFLPESP